MRLVVVCVVGALSLLMSGLYVHKVESEVEYAKIELYLDAGCTSEQYTNRRGAYWKCN